MTNNLSELEQRIAILEESNNYDDLKTKLGLTAIPEGKNIQGEITEIENLINDEETGILARLTAAEAGGSSGEGIVTLEDMIGEQVYVHQYTCYPSEQTGLDKFLNPNASIYEYFAEDYTYYGTITGVSVEKPNYVEIDISGLYMMGVDMSVMLEEMGEQMSILVPKTIPFTTPLPENSYLIVPNPEMSASYMIYISVDNNRSNVYNKTITGPIRVEDENGLPISGATVTFKEIDPLTRQLIENGETFSGTTDNSGYYTYEISPYKWHQVTVSATNYETNTSSNFMPIYKEFLIRLLSENSGGSEDSGGIK